MGGLRNGVVGRALLYGSYKRRRISSRLSRCSNPSVASTVRDLESLITPPDQGFDGSTLRAVGPENTMTPSSTGPASGCLFRCIICILRGVTIVFFGSCQASCETTRMTGHKEAAANRGLQVAWYKSSFR